MPLTISMYDPERRIIEELQDPLITQSSVALTYAFLMAQDTGGRANWPAINAAIRQRWKGKTALERVKTMAWKHVDEWDRRWRAAAEAKA